MSKYLVVIIILTALLACGCGTTTDETFDEIPTTSAAVQSQTSLPVASKISMQVSSPNVIFQGYTNSVEANATINIYNDAEVLLYTGAANNNGEFLCTFNNIADSTFHLSAIAPNKMESNYIFYVKM